MTKEIQVYSKEGCPYCSLLKFELANRSIRFVEFDLSDDGVRQMFYAEHNVSSVPQLFLVTINDEKAGVTIVNIGGYENCAVQWEALKSFGS